MWFCGRSDTGKVRQHNEDFWTFTPPHLAIVADGMGGHAAGEIASKMAARSVMTFLNEQSIIDESVLRASLERANDTVYQASQANENYGGMGTTMIICYEADDVVHWAHVGDSRLYVYRDKTLHQITQDHSFVGELERSGQITKEEAENHPKRNLLTRAIGADSEIEVDTGSFVLIENDVLLLCSDGLTNMAAEGEIANIIETYQNDLEQASVRLIERANENGGHDNITVILGKKENNIQQDT